MVQFASLELITQTRHQTAGYQTDHESSLSLSLTVACKRLQESLLKACFSFHLITESGVDIFILLVPVALFYLYCQQIFDNCQRTYRITLTIRSLS